MPLASSQYLLDLPTNQTADGLAMYGVGKLGPDTTDVKVLPDVPGGFAAIGTDGRLSTGVLPSVATPMISKVNGSSTSLVRGQPVAILSNQLWPCTTSELYYRFIGLVADDVILPGASGFVQMSGVMSLTMEQWNQVVEGQGGLAPEMTYFVNSAGELVTTPPQEDPYMVQVGYAINDTDFNIRLPRAIKL